MIVPDAVRRRPDHLVDGVEEWTLDTDDPDVRGVSVLLPQRGWPWMVTVAAAEFVRSEPLESQLRQRIHAALTAVDGVTQVDEEDREVWAVEGKPDGEALVHAVAAVLDELTPAIRAHVTDS
ncbi:hypothetical protein GCM10022251_33290 [Phytohabitans flavus]|uniref:Uncharacterized protein n=1 Tax=Phytohabitans flavus TaxID=1076124 RepID=A0A6F8XNC1_9ACTN|nr:hypothetical protein [Phytohabitans flavus]BCB75316.1 hypothetical protein Pflav_017260 [Phytohabitans flavus]